MGWGWVSVTSCLLAGGAVVWSLINSYRVFLPLNCPLKFPNWKRASGGKKGETCVLVPSAVSLDCAVCNVRCVCVFKLWVITRFLHGAIPLTSYFFSACRRCRSQLQLMTVYQLNVPALHTSFFACVCVFLLKFIMFVCLFVFLFAVVELCFFRSDTRCSNAGTFKRYFREPETKRWWGSRVRRERNCGLNDIFDKIKTLY